MFKKLLAIGLSLSLILASGAMITLADGGEVIHKGSETINTGIDSTDSYGALAAAEESGASAEASITVRDDVSVNYDGTGKTTSSTDDVVGIGAIADDSGDKADVSVGGNVSVTNNENTNNNDGDGLTTKGVLSSATGEGAKASTTVGGDVTVTNHANGDDTVGVIAFSYGEKADTSATVGGNVSVKSTDGEASGIIAVAGGSEESDDIKNATATVNVTGNVSADSTNNDVIGVSAGTSLENSSVTANVKGDVSATSTNGNSIGIIALADGKGATSDITIGGSVSVSAPNAENLSLGIFSESLDGGSVDITLEKNLIVTGPDKPSAGILIVSGNSENNAESSTNIHIGGNVTTSGNGIVVEQRSGKADIVIEGTINSKEDAVLLTAVDENPSENLNITVWKIESGNDSIVGLDTLTEGDLEAGFVPISEDTRRSVEQSINYIIRIDENQKNSIALSNTRQISGLDTARATEEVAVKLTIPAGYRLLDAYSDMDHTVKLQGNARDGYYLTVPRGGGVYVSLSLARIDNDNDDYDRDDGNDDPKPRNYIGNIHIDSISEDDFKFDEENGILTITIPSGTNAFNLDSAALLLFMEKGMKILYLDTVNGKYSIPVTDIKDLITPGNVLTFVIGEQKIDLFLGSILQRNFYPQDTA